MITISVQVKSSEFIINRVFKVRVDHVRGQSLIMLRCSNQRSIFNIKEFKLFKSEVTACFYRGDQVIGQCLHEGVQVGGPFYIVCVFKLL